MTVLDTISTQDASESLGTALATGVVPTPPSVASPYYDETLPSGTPVQILRRGTGKHLILAERMAKPGTAFGTMPWYLCLVAVKVRVNGRDVTVEEVEEMDDLDVVFLVGKVLGKGPSAVVT